MSGRAEKKEGEEKGEKGKERGEGREGKGERRKRDHSLNDFIMARCYNLSILPLITFVNLSPSKTYKFNSIIYLYI